MFGLKENREKKRGKKKEKKRKRDEKLTPPRYLIGKKIFFFFLNFRSNQTIKKYFLSYFSFRFLHFPSNQTIKPNRAVFRLKTVSKIICAIVLEI